MKNTLTLGYFIAVHAVLIIVLFKSDFMQRLDRKFNIHLLPTQEITEHYHHMLDFHRRMDGNVSEGAAIFIGDSLIQGLCVSAVVPTAVNYGIGQDTTVGVLQRLPLYQSLARASVIVMAIGVNDLKFRENPQILANYKAIIAQLPPSRPIVFSAVLPVNENLDEPKQGWNQRILALNTALQALVAQSNHLYYVDAGAVLRDADGKLADVYHIGDGLHLNTQGNAIWIKALQAAIQSAQ